MNESESLKEIAAVIDRNWWILHEAEIPDNNDEECLVYAFREELAEVLCKHVGHEFNADHCGKPEHDFCMRCNRLAPDLGYRRVEKWRWEKIEV